jgi:hypothetical protein
MSLRSYSALIASCLLANSIGAGERPAGVKNPTPDLASLVRQLGSDKYTEREEASAKLDALGPMAIEHLRRAKHSSDPEVQRRVHDLLTRIQVRVESARLIQPKRIRLVYADMPLTKAVEDIGRRTGVTINLTGDQQKNEKRKITLDTGDVTFWQAMDQFCQKSGLSENEPTALPDGQNAEAQWERRMMFRRMWIDYAYQSPIQQAPLTLQDGKPHSMPTYHAGAIRIRVWPPGFPKNAPKINSREDELVLNIEITPEPRLGWQGLKGMRLEKVLDDQGQEIPAPMPYIAEDSQTINEGFGGGFTRYYNGHVDNGSGSKFVAMRVQKPKGKAKLFKQVEGKLAGEILSPLEPLISVNNIMESVGESFPSEHGGSVKVVEAAKGEGETLKLRVVVESPPRNNNGQIFFGGGVFLQPQFQVEGEATDNYLAQIDRELSLLDSKGRHLKLIEASTNDQENVANPTKEYHLTYDFPAGSPKASKLIYSGQRLVIVETSFTLNDVPLP